MGKTFLSCEMSMATEAKKKKSNRLSESDKLTLIWKSYWEKTIFVTLTRDLVNIFNI